MEIKLSSKLEEISQKTEGKIKELIEKNKKNLFSDKTDNLKERNKIKAKKFILEKIWSLN